MIDLDSLPVEVPEMKNNYILVKKLEQGSSGSGLILSSQQDEYLVISAPPSMQDWGSGVSVSCSCEAGDVVLLRGTLKDVYFTDRGGRRRGFNIAADGDVIMVLRHDEGVSDYVYEAHSTR